MGHLWVFFIKLMKFSIIWYEFWDVILKCINCFLCDCIWLNTKGACVCICMWKKSQKPIYYFSISCYLWVWNLFFLYIESVVLHALKIIILTLVRLDWLWYGMVLFTAEVPEVPLLCWPKVTCLWTSGCGGVEGEAMGWMGPGSGRLVNGEQRLFFPVERAANTHLSWSQDRKNTVSVSLSHPSTSKEAKSLQ